jgi:hypothetical protein
MATAQVVETLDKFEHLDPCHGLHFEPAPAEKLAFQRTEEACAHCRKFDAHTLIFLLCI